MGKVLQVASLALGLMAAGFSAQASAETKIAVINVPRIMQEIPQGKAVEAKLKSEFSSRISEMQRLETEGQNLAAKLKKDEAFMAADERTKLQRRLAELQADFNLKGQALQEDQRRRFNEEQKKVPKEEPPVLKEKDDKIVSYEDFKTAALHYDVNHHVW